MKNFYIQKQHRCEELEKSPDGYAVLILYGQGNWYLQLMESTGPVIIYDCPFCGIKLREKGGDQTNEHTNTNP